MEKVLIIWCAFVTIYARSFSVQNMEKTRPMREEMDKKVFIFRESRHFFFLVNMNKVVFPFCTFTWRLNVSFPAREKPDLQKKTESAIF